MSRLPKLCAALCLTLALAFNAFGDGNIGCPYVPTHTTSADQPQATVGGDTLIQSTLDLLQNVLSLY
jgi:hypothetical protein